MNFPSLRFVALSLLMSTFMIKESALGQVLTSSGPCPGVMTFTITGILPDTRTGFLYSWNTGSYVIPGGFPCTGTTLGLDSPVTIGYQVLANGFGVAEWTVFVPGPACGNVYMQGIDADPCITTNVILVN